MAFGNKGADWLAKEEAVRNPYFGDKMMKCGLVKKVLE
jgi:Cu(I)/Ag(I) efflux system membrane fusion protein